MVIMVKVKMEIATICVLLYVSNDLRNYDLSAFITSFVFLDNVAALTGVDERLGHLPHYYRCVHAVKMPGSNQQF